MVFKSTKQLLIELVLLAVLVGFIPELVITGISDIFGPCGFKEEICKQIELVGVKKLVGAWVCAAIAVVIVFFVSQELNVKRTEAEGL